MISTKVHNSPWVVTLRNALTPRPRYIRARPASMGLGFAGSGPDRAHIEWEVSYSTIFLVYLELDDGRFRERYARDRLPMRVAEFLS